MIGLFKRAKYLIHVFSRKNVHKIASLARKGEYSEALKLFGLAAQLDRRQLYHISGYCYLQLGEFELAVRHLELGKRENPRDIHTNFYLGQAYRNIGETKKASEQFLYFLGLNEKSPDDLLGEIITFLFETQSNKIGKSRLLNDVERRVSELCDRTDINKLRFDFFCDTPSFSDTLSSSVFGVYKIGSVAEIECKTNIQSRILGEPETYRCIPATPAVDDIFVTAPVPYVAEIPDAIINSGSSIVIKDNYAISDILSHRQYGKFCDTASDHRIIARSDENILFRRPEVSETLESGVMLCGNASNAYGHWTAEFLPKLRFYLQHPDFSKMPLIIDDGMPLSHYEFLNCITENPQYRLQQGKSIMVRKLLLTPTDSFFPTDLKPNHEVPPQHQSTMTRGAISFLSEKITAKFGSPPEAPTGKIYLSRQNSKWRRLSNELEICEILASYGFLNVSAENYSFEEQVRLFQNAKFIIGSNGSALNNIVFSSKNARTIILGQKELFNWGSWLGNFIDCGYQVEYFSEGALPCKILKHSDYTVSANSLIKRLHAIDAVN